jgi:hypothetical protein
MRRVCLILVLAHAPLPLAAQEGLESLIPLTELYGPGGSSPAFDVAGIRCAALYGAQERHGRQNLEARPTRAQMEHFQSNLDQAQQVRVNAGLGYATARESVEEDLFRVMDLYLAVVAENERRGRRWDDGALLHADKAYCQILNR